MQQFKSDFLDQVADGATDFLLCIAVNRRDIHAAFSIEAIVETARERHPEITVTIANFKSVYDSSGLISKIDAFQPSREKLFSDILEDIEAWVVNTHPDRLILHSRALRGLRKSLFQDVPLIYASLDLLAREYRDTKLASPALAASKAQALEERLKLLGIELTPSISESRAGEQGDDYFIEFPLGGGKKFLDQHLKKGVAHDERLCLRIYFFWSATHRSAVVGWMTSHLETRNG